MPRRPCLTCGTPTTGTRCPTHQHARRQAKYGGTWRRDSERQRAQHLATIGPICPGWHRPAHPVNPNELHVDHDEGVLCCHCNDSKAATADKRGGGSNL